VKNNASGHFLVLVRYRQRSVFGIDDEDSQQARRIRVTCILTDPVMRARHLVEAFADLVDLSGLIVNLAANGAGAAERSARSQQSLSNELPTLSNWRSGFVASGAVAQICQAG